MMEEIVGYTDMQMDALREVSSIGAGHAATALSKLIGRTVVTRVPNVNLVKIEQGDNFRGWEEGKPAHGVYFMLSGELVGSSLVIFSSKSARLLVDAVLGKENCSLGQITEDIEISALTESCNIIAGSYLAAMGSMTGLAPLQSIPYYASGTIGAIFDSVLAEVGLSSDTGLVIEIEFIEGSKRLHGWFYVLPDMNSSTRILDALGVE